MLLLIQQTINLYFSYFSQVTGFDISIKMDLSSLLRPDQGLFCLPLIQQCLNTPTSSEMDLLPYFSIWLPREDVFNAQYAG